MAVPRVFSAEGVSPYDQVDWERRTAAIKDEAGKVIFEIGKLMVVRRKERATPDLIVDMLDDAPSE